ncbi:NAD(P)H-dependent oxidoreductase subunit E [Streptomyces sanglieri]|uniref:NAD(P)H-dependent oxidoreductase subunit E n=1 Tax=Streptomyces sanglieri TaxID=193460 RepID=A0ABW2WP77_9ACTN
MDPVGSADRFDAFRALAGRRGRPGARLIRTLAEARTGTADSPEVWAPAVAARVGLPAAAGLGPAGYYADLVSAHGRRHVRVCSATACFAAQGGRHLADAEHSLGVVAGIASPGGETSLQSVRCLGYCYAGPAALDGDTPARARRWPVNSRGVSRRWRRGSRWPTTRATLYCSQACWPVSPRGRPGRRL